MPEDSDHAAADGGRAAISDLPEPFFQHVVASAAGGIWVLDARAETRYVNSHAAALLGRSPDELRGVAASELVEPGTLDDSPGSRLDEAWRDIELPIKRADGATVWVTANAARLFDPAGALDGTVVMISKVAPRRQAEQALRESERRLRELLDMHPDTIVRLTRDGVYLDVHIMDGDRDRVPFAEADLVGHKVDEFFDPEFAAHHARLRAHALETREIQRWEYEWEVDGEANHYEARFVPAGDEVLVTIRNHTELKRVETELATVAARLEALTEASFDGVLTSKGGRIRAISARLAALLGYDVEDLVDSKTSDLVTSPSPPTDVEDELAGLDGPFVGFANRKDGVLMPIEICAATVAEPEGGYRIYAIRDIGTRTRLEREIIDIAERERQRIGRDLHDGLGQILTGASLALGGLIKKLRATDTDLDREAENITATVQRAIGEVRHIARTLAPNIPGSGFRRALIRLGNEVNKFTALHCTTRIDENCEIHDETAATHLYRIAQEGLHNAIRHSGGKNVMLGCRRDGRRLVLEIVDDGVGIPPEDTRADGTGLKNMRYRAHSLNGTIEAAATAAGGTRLVCRCFAQPEWFVDSP